MMYLPNYDPAYIWGPSLYYPYANWGYPPFIGGAYFGFGLGIPMGLYFGGGWGGWGGWGWGIGWGNHSLFVNNSFIHRNDFNAGRGASLSGRSNWSHDASHRGGVPYANAGVSSRYGGNVRQNLQSRGASAGTAQSRGAQSQGARAEGGQAGRTQGTRTQGLGAAHPRRVRNEWAIGRLHPAHPRRGAPSAAFGRAARCGRRATTDTPVSVQLAAAEAAPRDRAVEAAAPVTAVVAAERSRWRWRRTPIGAKGNHDKNEFHLSQDTGRGLARFAASGLAAAVLLHAAPPPTQPADLCDAARSHPGNHRCGRA